ncbi:MAG: hypothetical protein M1818_000206 [Claussenomyces sp. TS43310]|nr:MAG: hypothetical protein M1818_000206 [Claussenomyces sp. TS43310]
MLSWWGGQSGEDATSREDDQEPPETPAPVFAARAIKSALFGTPRPPDEYESTERSEFAYMPREGGAGAKSDNMSPIKPQGILMTPGTAAARRKTVSFGTSVVDNEGKVAAGRSGLPNDFPGKFPSPWTPKIENSSQTARQTSLTKALESARDGRSKKTDLTKAPIPDSMSLSTSDPKKAEKIVETHTAGETSQSCRPQSCATMSADTNADMTLDLNKPHSQSGKYWKMEYERYHEEAKVEMKKLVKYKQLAKSYARKKDDEALDLVERLHEEQRKVVAMEEKLTELAAYVAQKRLSGDESDSPELLKDLARRTALALQYKDEVNQFQAALYDRQKQLDHEDCSHVQRYTSPKTAQTIADVSQELRKAREQLAELNSLQSDMHGLRLNLSAAEKRASKLKEANLKLSKDLIRAQEDLERSERRRQAAEESCRKQEESLQNLHTNYNELKNLAKSQRHDAEVLLKERHDQVASLKKNIRSLKERAEAQPDRAKDDLRKERIQLLDAQDDSVPPREQNNRRLLQLKGQGQKGEHQDISTADVQKRSELNNGHHSLHDSARDRSHEDNLNSKAHSNKRDSVKPSKSQNDGFIPHVEGASDRMRQVRPSPSALSEIVDNGQSPDNILSPVKQSFTTAPSLAIGDEQHIRGQWPSMINIPSSPPMEAFIRGRSAVRDFQGLCETKVSSSRLSSMASTRSRLALPPERAAAAKARLEQRNAQKRSKEKVIKDQKENLR